MILAFGDLVIGDGIPCAFVAECGSFFNKDMGLATEYMRMSNEAGVDAFKTEILHSSDVVMDIPGFDFVYKTSDGTVSENYRSFIERKTLPLVQYSKLFQYAADTSLRMIATVFDRVGVDFLVEHEAAGIKISRNNLKHKSLIKYASRSGLPIIFDLGDVPLWSAMRAKEWVDEEGGRCMFNHHPGLNPAPYDTHNLACVKRYKKVFETPIGLSCHFRGDELLYTAIGAGANLIEKGVDVNPNRKEADLVSSLAFDELSSVVAKVKGCASSIGSATVPVYEYRHSSQMTGIIAARDINVNENVTEDMIKFAWPPMGIESEYVDLVLGVRLKRPVKKGDAITFEDLGVAK